jgi:hypothetical protein
MLAKKMELLGHATEVQGIDSGLLSGRPEPTAVEARRW